MQQQGDPITDVKIVSDKAKAPAGYFFLERTINGHNGQLYDTTWRHKGQRFICYSKQPGANVLTDITVVNDGDPVAAGYSAITHTLDDGEKALRKHQLLVKMLPKQQVTQAICDIVLVNKSKGEAAPPGFYTITNDVNEIFICFKNTAIVNYAAPGQPQGGYPSQSAGYQYSYSSAPHSVGPNRQQWYPGQPQVPQGPNQQMQASWQQPRRQAPPVPGSQAHQQQPAPPYPQGYAPHHAMPAAKPTALSAIEGLPFQVNPKFELMWKKSGPSVPNIESLSVDDINSKYSYDFTMERGTISR